MRHAYAGFALLGLLWGSNFMYMKLAVQWIDPLQVVWIRVVTGAVPILLYGLARGELRRRDWKHVGHFFVMAWLANVLPFYCFAKGTMLLKSGIAGVISGTIPLVAAVLAALFLPAEKLNKLKVAGLFAGFVGVLTIGEAWNKGWGLELRGEAYIVLGALAYGATFVYAKRFASRLGLSPVALAAYQTSLAAILLTALTPLQGVERILLDPKALIAAAVGLGLMGTGVANILNYAIIEKLGAVTASSVTYVPPVVALIIGRISMGENVSFVQLLGTLLIVSGIFFVRKGNERA